MRSESILKCLREAIAALRVPGFDAELVVAPNELVDAADRSFFFQVATMEHETQRETERCDVVRTTGVIVVNARLGEGHARADAVSERIRRFFTAGSPGAKGFTIRSEPGAAHAALVYVSGVRRGSPEVVDGRYKITVYIDFEIFEKE